MLAEIGHFLLLLSLMLALSQAMMPQRLSLLRWRASTAQLLAVTGAFGCLIACFVLSDFSVASVAMHSHRSKPLLYKITASWGHHEGSLVLWVWVLAFYSWSLRFAARSPLLVEAASNSAVTARAVGLLGWLQAGFLLFLLLTSNPFERVVPVPFEGQGFNPLLQDIGLAMHPPLLYLGYVGFCVAFALACAALLERRMDAAFGRLLAGWVLVPWGFLTLGIGLGSWWAYRELGWGGWWFWDAVENASLLPWLAGAALLHSVMVLETQGKQAAWVAFLSIMAFSLSLIGTFLVRSGLITSVHSFANDPERGIFILLYLLLVTGGALLLFALRYPARPSSSPGPVALLSREGGIVLNNLFLMVACASVLLATIYPMIHEALGGRSLSIGAPYYEKTFFPLMTPLMILAGIGPLLVWRHGVRRWQVIAVIGGVSLVISVAFLVVYFPISPWFVIGIFLGCWVCGGALVSARRKLRNPALRWPAMVGSFVGHFSLGVFLLALSFYAFLRFHSDVTMRVGEVAELGDYRLTFEHIEHSEGPNYTRLTGHFALMLADGEAVALKPELRHYPERGMQTTEAAIDSTLYSDRYLVLRKPQTTGASLSSPEFTVSFHENPLMLWLWLGMVGVGLSGIFAGCYRIRRNLTT